MMRSRFDEQLAQLNKQLIEMGALCEEVISMASRALMDGDLPLAAKVAPLDAEIDQKERDVESLCLKLLLQQQPVAKDLRQISAALKMITDMERIGDQATDIAEISLFMEASQAKSVQHIGAMAVESIRMVNESVEAFVKSDLALADRVIKYDDVVDDLFCQVRADVASILAETPALAAFALDVLMIAKYLERIADHATNIAEWVEFSVTGSRDGIS